LFLFFLFARQNYSLSMPLKMHADTNARAAREAPSRPNGRRLD
jgi:hypothetical protein